MTTSTVTGVIFTAGCRSKEIFKKEMLTGGRSVADWQDNGCRLLPLVLVHSHRASALVSAAEQLWVRKLSPHMLPISLCAISHIGKSRHWQPKLVTSDLFANDLSVKNASLTCFSRPFKPSKSLSSYPIQNWGCLCKDCKEMQGSGLGSWDLWQLRIGREGEFCSGTIDRRDAGLWWNCFARTGTNHQAGPGLV